MRVSRRNLRKGLVAVGCLVAQPVAGSIAAGLSLLVLGALLHWLSKAYLEQNRRLTTAGPYRWTRNPFYLANLFIDTGIVLTIGRLWVGVAYGLLWRLAYHRTIAAEEAELRSRFGADFDRYVEAVPRLFPLRRPLPLAEAQGRFDLGNPSLASGREYARLLGIALAPAVILGAMALRREGLAIFEDSNARLLGTLLLLPVIWILKLALAETFRAPATPLLWGRSRSLQRVVLLLLSILPLGVGMLLAAASHWLIAGLCMLATSIVAIERMSRRGLRAIGFLSALLASAGLAFAVGQSYMAAPSVLGLGIAALDDLGALRCESRELTRVKAPWRYAGRVAVGGVLALGVVVAARLTFGG